jgi:Fe-S oxidoreductase
MLQDSRAEKLAKNSFLLEEFLATQSQNNGLDLGLKEALHPFLLHGHCHSKAIVGMEPTVDMLKLIPNAKVEVVDSGCCGMAGSFGFEKEHYQISMAIGRRRLFGAVESKDDDWQVVAPGVSCRQQIQHGTGRSAKHPVEVLAEHLLPAARDRTTAHRSEGKDIP